MVDVFMSNLLAKNRTSSSITVNGYTVYSIDRDSAETITVSDDGHNKYSSFKCVINGTEYYYVIDGIHCSWVSDLSSIGYRIYEEPLGMVLMDIETGNEIPVFIPEPIVMNKNIHIANINKSLVSIPVLETAIIRKDLHMPSIDRSLLDVQIPSIDLITKD